MLAVINAIIMAKEGNGVMPGSFDESSEATRKNRPASKMRQVTKFVSSILDGSTKKSRTHRRIAMVAPGL